jgi:MFS family permease
VTTQDRRVEFEEAEDAYIEGDTPLSGTALAALRHRDFRVVWFGAMASNIGTWMQNVVLGAFAYQLTKSAGFVALIGFAQLGPLLLLSIVGGALADAVDRRRLLIFAQTEQMVLSFVLAFVAAHHPSQSALFFCVLAIGIGNALNAPAFSAVLPQLVDRKDLSGAVSLQSVQMNLSRVVGPAIGGLILPAVGVPGVFSINALTYLFAIGTLLVVKLPAVPVQEHGGGWSRLVGGFREARRDVLVGRILITITVISFFSLPFIGLMPVLAAKNLGIHNPAKSTAYGLLYASFGLGAACGAVAVGTVLVRQSRPRIIRVGLTVFSVFLGLFAAIRSLEVAYAVVFLVGLFYFATVTALSTLLQEHLADEVRGRVMALWIMGFGGTVPIGLLVFGRVADATSVTAVVLGGAVIALVLAFTNRLRSAVAAVSLRSA